MSFLFGNKGPSSAEKIQAVETELEMVSDMFNRYAADLFPSARRLSNNRPRLVHSCVRKCVPNDYRENDLNKGESVCLDRCVSKFFDVNMKVSEKMQSDSRGRGGAGGMGGGLGL